MIIRPVLAKDLQEIEELDLSYYTDSVWQMEQKAAGEEVSTTFRTVHLPRAIKVEQRHDGDWLDNWQSCDLFLVAEEEKELVGYLQLEVNRGQKLGKIGHLAISLKKRRQGFGTALFQEVKRWSKVRKVRVLAVETQTKNFPAINFFQKAGFTFCGFNDSCYQSRDIAVFFVCNLV